MRPLDLALRPINIYKKKEEKKCHDEYEFR